MGNAALEQDDMLDAIRLANELTGNADEGETDDDGDDEESNEGFSAVSPGVEPPPSTESLDPDAPRIRLRPKAKAKPGRKGNPFSNMMGAGERLLIWKRLPNAKLGFVGEYSPDDLKRSGTIELFIKEYLVPTYEYGEYATALKATDGSVKPMGSVTVTGPARQQDNETTKLADLMKLQQDLNDKARKESQGELDNTLKMMTLFDKMSNRSEKSGGGDNGMMMMMLMMMMNRPQPQDSTATILPLIMKMLDKQSDPMPAMPPFGSYMPPMPASSSSASEISDVVKVVAEVMKASRPAKEAGLGDIVDVMKALRPSDGNSLTLKDVLTLLPTVKNLVAPPESKHGTDDFRRTLENFGMLQTLLGNAGGGDGNFWDFASTMAEQFPKLAEAIKAKQEAEAKGNTNGATPPKKKAGTPAEFKPYAKKMQSAFDDENDGQLLEQTLRGLIALRKSDEKWKKHIDGFIQHCKLDRKDDALKYLKAFLNQFVKDDLIEVDVAEAAFECFKAYWDTVLETLGFKQKTVPEAPAPTEGVAGVEPKATATAAPSEDGPGAEEDEDDEDGEDAEDEDEPELDDDEDDDEVEADPPDAS